MKIKDMIDALEKEGYEIKEPQKKKVEWDMSMADQRQYWYISDGGIAMLDSMVGSSWDIIRYKQGNTFPSKEEAEQQIKLNNLTADYLELIRQTNEKAGLVIDWADVGQDRTTLTWDILGEFLMTYPARVYQNCPENWYWLIDEEEAFDIARQHFTDNELKAIITQDRSLL